jgi:hypothetical protein
MWSTKLQAQGESSPALASVWARGRLRELEDRYVVATHDRAALEKEIVGVSLRFGVLCRFTSFVAVDRSAVVNPGGQVHSLVQPVEQPEGWGQTNATLAACMPCAAPSPASAKPECRDDSEFELSLGVTDFDAAEEGSFTGEVRRMRGPRAKAKSSVPPTAPPRGRVQSRTTPAGPAPEEQAEADRQRAARGEPIKASPPSLLRRILRRLGLLGKKTKGRQALPAAGREQYRPRVQELLKALAGCPTTLAAHQLQVLRSLCERLTELVRDLVFAGEGHPAVKPLAEALVHLNELLAESSPTDFRIHDVWNEVEAALRGYLDSLGQSPAAPVADAPGSPAPKREDFWK